MSNPFLDGEAIREASKPVVAKPMPVNGSAQLVAQGIRALEALGHWGDGIEIAEIRIYENLPIEAVVMHVNEKDPFDPTAEFETWRWNGEAWLFPENQ